MKIRNKKLNHDEFFRERKEVLAMWPTGKEVDLDQAVEFHKSLLQSKNFVLKLAEAKQRGDTLLVSDMGHTTIKQEIELLKYIQDEGRPDFLGTHVDSLTRNLRFKEAEDQLRKSEGTSQNLLNGFPVVAHGVVGNRKVIESVDLPVRLRFVSPTGRLLTEIALAGGHTSVEGHQITCFMNYSQTDHLETVIREFQYIARLVGYYEEKGVPILVHSLGGNHIPGMTPPSLILASSIVNLLMLPEQGVKNVVITFASQGNLIQDIAYGMAIPKLCETYLNKLCYEDIAIFTSGGEISGRYPLDHAQAFAEVMWAPIVAVLAGVDLCHIKTIDEAETIPTKENNAFSLRGVRMMLNMLKDQRIDLLSSKEVLAEAEMQELEVRAIVDKVLDLGDGDAVVGAIKAVDLGVLDHPVTSNQFALSRVMGVRDARGAVRYLEYGNLPFNSDIIDFHKQKIAEREKAIGKSVDFDTVVSDFLSISKGSLLPSP